MTIDDEQRQQILDEERVRFEERRRLAALQRKSHTGLAVLLVLAGLAVAAAGLIGYKASQRDDMEVAAENVALALACVDSTQGGGSDPATCDQTADEGGNMPVLVGGLAIGAVLLVVGVGLGMQSSRIDAERRRATSSG